MQLRNQNHLEQHPISHTQTVTNDIKIETHPPVWCTLIIWIQLASYAQCAEQIYI